MNVTYLIGAGASAGANAMTTKVTPSGEVTKRSPVIPVVAGFTRALIRFLEDLGKVNGSSLNQKDGLSSRERMELTKKVSERLPSFIEDLHMHYSVDTLARKYYIKHGVDCEQLRFLKFSVSSFLFARQYQFGVDPRYDLFFSAIGDRSEQGGLSLPDSVAIVSWNYDNQLELSLNGFHAEGTYSELRKKLNLFPQISESASPFHHNSFSILKLNGTCDMVKMLEKGENGKDVLNHTPHAQYDNEKMTVRYGKHRQWLNDCILKVYNDQFNNPVRHRSLLSFSWEQEPELDDIRSNAVKIADRTHVLVVIGYSFPTFNRRLDRAFIEGLTKGNKLQKVYVQVSDVDFISVKSRLSALFPSNYRVGIEQVPQLDEFYVPYELDLEEPKMYAFGPIVS